MLLVVDVCCGDVGFYDSLHDHEIKKTSFMGFQQSNTVFNYCLFGQKILNYIIFYPKTKNRKIADTM